MPINQQIVMHLLNRLHEFNEWGQCSVLDLVARYTPTNDKEMFDIMVRAAAEHTAETCS
jgi:AP-4 complex subunit beta-1